MASANADDYGPYKDTSGRYRTLSLFMEYNKDASYVSPYNLKKHQLPTNPPSLYLMYMDVADPTEYSFAMKALGSWDHWCVLCDTNWFKPHIEEWRADLRVKLASEHYGKVRDEALKATKASDRITALRWLAANSGYESPKSSRGRPSKAEVEGRLKQELKSLEEDKEDLERLGL